MKILRIRRLWAREDGSFGILEDYDRKFPIALTAELKWKNNEKNFSCVPTGEYDCVYEPSFRFGRNMWRVVVPNREGILFHSGNCVEIDSRGCILLGMQWGVLQDKLAVLHSRIALDYFNNYLKGLEKFRLIIDN